MKTLIISQSGPPLLGGSAVAALKYAEYLYSKDKDGVLFLCPRNPYWNKSLANQFSFIKVFNVPYFKRIKSGNRWQIICNWAYYQFIAIKILIFLWPIRNNINAVHLFDCWLDFNFASIRAAKWLRLKVITETCLIGADDPATILTKSRGISISINRLRVLDYLKSDFFISKSPYMSELFSKQLISKKCFEIPYFVDTSKFNPCSPKEQVVLKEQFGFNATDTIILFVGRLNERKGVSFLLDAFKKLLVQKLNNVYLILISPVDKANISVFQESIINKVKDVEFKNRVKHIDYHLDNVHDYMRLCDIYCLPSFQEGFPISICEAMCCEKFIVASNIEEINGPQLEHLKSGYLVNPGSVCGLQQGFNFYLNDKEKAQVLALNAYRSALSRFSLKSIANSYSHLT